MANWSDLKASVAEVIKTNGNQEITGQILQNTLNSIISNLGENATFAGIATPTTNPGTPDGPVFYLASQSGTYSNFGGITLTDDEVAFLLWKTSWTKLVTGLAKQSALDDFVSNIMITCTTAANTAIKIVNNVDNFKLKDGVRFIIKFSYNNTASSIVLNINNTGAKEVYYDGKLVSVTNSYPANTPLDIFYSEADNAYFCTKFAVDNINSSNVNDTKRDKNQEEINDELYKTADLTYQSVTECQLTETKAILDNSGNIITWGDCNLTDFIPIEEFSKYIFTLYSTSNSQRICTYNEDKSTIVRIFVPQDLDIKNQEESKFYLETVGDEKYIRFASKTGYNPVQYKLFGEISIEENSAFDFDEFVADNLITNYFNKDGGFVSINSGYYTQRIKIIPGRTYYQNSSQGITTYDKNGNLKRSLLNGTTNITAADDESYANFRIDEPNLNTFMVTCGVEDYDYLPYGKYLVKYDNLSHKNYLFNKVFYLISDSIGYGLGNSVNRGKSWYDYMLTKIGASKLSNKDAVPSQCLRTMADRLTDETLQNVDKIFVSGGTNSENVFSLGTIEDEPTPDDWKASTSYRIGDKCLGGTRETHGSNIQLYTYVYECVTAGVSGNTEDATGFTTTKDNTSVDGTVTWKCLGIATFYGDLWRIVKKIYRLKPNIDIIFIVPPKTTTWKTWGGYTSKLLPKFEAIRTFCKEIGIRYIDFNNEFPISEYTNDVFMADNLHPSYNGYMLLADIAISHL